MTRPTKERLEKIKKLIEYVEDTHAYTMNWGIVIGHFRFMLAEIDALEKERDEARLTTAIASKTADNWRDRYAKLRSELADFCTCVGDPPHQCDACDVLSADSQQDCAQAAQETSNELK